MIRVKQAADINIAWSAQLKIIAQHLNNLLIFSVCTLP